LSTDSDSAEDQVAKKEMEALLHTKIREFKKKLTPRELEIFDYRVFSDTPAGAAGREKYHQENAGIF
jgi:RNA polymerase sigma-32 factor